MSGHEKRIVTCTSPADLHAFHGITVQKRPGQLDALCPTCCGHGQWNAEIDLNSHRSKRVICDHCDGHGWVETGSDPERNLDIVMTPEGYPKWVVRLGII